MVGPNTLAKRIPHYAPALGGNELAYLTECVETGWVSSVGPFVDRFERIFADYHGVDTATAVSSGTAAIHLGLLSLGVEPGDLVLAPCMTFVGSVNPVRHCGADPVFLDVGEHLNLDPTALREFLERETEPGTRGLRHRATGRRISALIVVHLYGNPAPIAEILDIAQHHHLPILEDAAESLGARYDGRLVGTFGEVGCFSFNGNKIVTTGGGGMIIARDPTRTQFCKHLSTQAKVDPVDFMHDRVGFNYRLSNLCGAVGVAQMERLNEFIERKRSRAQRYKAAFARSQVWELVGPPDRTQSNYWMHLAQLKQGPRPGLLDRIRRWTSTGLGVRPVWHPLHDLPPYRACIARGGERALSLYERIICLPSSVGLLDDEIEFVAAELENL